MDPQRTDNSHTGLKAYYKGRSEAPARGVGEAPAPWRAERAGEDGECPRENPPREPPERTPGENPRREPPERTALCAAGRRRAALQRRAAVRRVSEKK